MKIKPSSVFASILALAVVITPLTAQACGDKNKNNPDANLPEGTETSQFVTNNSYSV